ncbi:FEKKY domain-containing protein [Tenacibaculum jejuense]|nr:hypothetical protein [Tenacibaculum jejuense]
MAFAISDIKINVIILNSTKKEFKSGTLIINDKNKKEVKKMIINTLSSTIFLDDESTQYNFSFKSTGFITNFYYSQNNEIIIRLSTTKSLNSISYNKYLLNQKDTNDRYLEGELSFILFGIQSTISNEMKAFKEKYNVSFEYKNCVVDPILMKQVSAHNREIYTYLKKKIGTQWLLELPVSILGIKER